VAAIVAGDGCALAAAAPANIAPPPPQLGAASVVFPSGSGSQIHAWFIPGRPGGGSVLLLHGVGANRTVMLGRAEFLHREGFTVLAPDFQAHGESPGEHPTFGALEALDARAAMSYLRCAAPGERIGVIGVSMGGAATLLGPGPLHADAFVLESVYPTIRQAVSDRLATWFGPLRWVGRQLAPAVIKVVGSEVHVRESQLQPIARIATVRAPMLVIAGTEDPYTPIAEAESLYAHVHSTKSFWAVPGAGHEDMYDFNPPAYRHRVGGFLTRWLRRDVPDDQTAAATADPSCGTVAPSMSEAGGADERRGGG
jgi:pimeloyl-ACP methyl ester carboxylesterase